MFRFLTAISLLFFLAACGAPPSEPRFLSYSGPEVTHIVVSKAARRMYLLHGNNILRSYDVALGQNPIGHKSREGDGRTPEGTYIIDRRNPNSSFHLSLGISYPNSRDVARARAAGVSPGGDIFIHGAPSRNVRRGGLENDWTWGCIAVSNEEIEEIYSMVQNGTPITLTP